MRITGLFLILCITTIIFGFSKGEVIFQVITSHPHDLKELAPYIKTTYKNGRLWLVKLSKPAPQDVLNHLRPLSGGEKSYSFDSSIKEDLLETQNTDILEFTQNVEKSFIKKDVEWLSSFKTRATGTQDNRNAVKLVQDRFKEMGFEVKDICHRSDACGFIADKNGTQSIDQILMIMGHIDSVGQDFAGADDNASGTAVMLEMARVLSSHSNKKTIRFFITNGEEQGLLGATYFARLLEKENKLKNLSLVINMDMVGYNSNGVVELETDPQFESLAKWFSSLTLKYTKLTSKITLGAWGSDHVPFLKRNVPAILTIENWDTKTPCYHQKCDTPDTINYDYAAEITKLNLAAVLEKDLINFVEIP